MTIGFTGSPLLRHNHERADAAELARQLADPQARLLRLEGLDPVVEAGEGYRGGRSPSASRRSSWRCWGRSRGGRRLWR